jgi:hypothetical protein
MVGMVGLVGMVGMVGMVGLVNHVVVKDRKFMTVQTRRFKRRVVLM